MKLVLFSYVMAGLLGLSLAHISHTEEPKTTIERLVKEIEEKKPAKTYTKDDYFLFGFLPQMCYFRQEQGVYACAALLTEIHEKICPDVAERIKKNNE